MSKNTVKANINYRCPTCNNTVYIKDINTGETYCKKCGLIILTPYPYVAGQKHKTLSDFQIEKEDDKKLKRMMKIWKKTISVHMQHG
jgi:transcription initiation factor TFIIIB Brf1 subunit/transcription initiation factor TFIIB